jgi:hypothetical protein
MRMSTKKPQDLIEHSCINLRLPTYGGLYAWEFEKGNRELKVRVDGQLIFNGLTQRLNAALAGLARHGVCAGGCGAAACRRRRSHASARGLVSAVSGMLYYPSRTRLCSAGGCPAI